MIQGNDKKRIRIIHAGDLHLDSAFCRYGVASGELRREELRRIFSELIGYIRVHDIDVVLLSGDLFDSEYATHSTLEMLIRELSSCRAEFFISPGNHDPYRHGSIYTSGRFPENVHIFSEEGLCSVDIDRLGVTVYGWAFTGISHSFSPLAGKRVTAPDRINLVCGHCDTDSALSSYCPVTESDISSFSADYAGFSHIHNITEPKKLGACTYAYSGFLESRSFDERGMGGAWLVEIEKNGEKRELTYRRLNFGRRRHEILTVDISGATDAQTAYEKIRAALSSLELGTQCSLRVILSGAVSPSFSLRALEGYSYGVEYIEFKNNTTPTYDAQYLESDMTIKGELYRYLLPSLTVGTREERELAALALKMGIGALDGADVTLITE